MMKTLKIIGIFLLKTISTLLGSILILSIIFITGCSIENPNLFDSFKGSTLENDMVFEDIETINIKADNINLTVIESDTDKVLVKNSVETTGFGVLTEPKIWISDNTLFYDQGLILNIDTWDIFEDNFNIHTSGSLIIEVPKDIKIDYIIDNPNGNVDFDVEEALSVSISAGNEITFNTNCESLDITTNDQNVNIYSSLQTLNALTKSGNINIFAPINAIKAMTKNGDISLYANQETNSIDFDTKSGTLNIFAENIGGYNHNNEYTSLSNNYNHTIDIKALEVNIYDKNTINELDSFFKEDN